jgi:hypothetical protein
MSPRTNSIWLASSPDIGVRPSTRTLVTAGEATADHGLAEEAGAAGDEDEGRVIHRARRGGPFLGELQAVDLGVVTDVDRQGALEDDVLARGRPAG